MQEVQRNDELRRVEHDFYLWKEHPLIQQRVKVTTRHELGQEEDLARRLEGTDELDEERVTAQLLQ